VFHFSEGNNDTAFDATQYAFKGVPQRTSATNYSFPADTVGVIGRTRRYGTNTSGNPSATSNTAGNYFTVPGSAAPLDFAMGGPYTLSTWAIVSSSATSRTLFSKSDRQYSFERRNSGTDREVAEHNEPLGGWQVVSAPSTPGVWTHLVGVRNNNTSALYLDGALVDTEPNSDATTTARITTTDLNIGRSPDGGNNNAARYYWRGVLDEVRVASVARSADWAKLEFENQKAAQSLVWLTQPPVVIGIGEATARAATFGFTAKPLGNGMVFQIQGAEAGKVRVALVDMWGRTVWSRTTASTAGTNQVVWNGQATSGSLVSSGVYVVRVSLLDAGNKVAATSERRVPLTR
jgi:hypothetical protein